MPKKTRKKHYYKRAYQRASIGRESSAKAFAKNALRYGHPPQYYIEGKGRSVEMDAICLSFYQFLLGKQSCGKRVKVYRGWIFIFNSTNNNAVTVYPVPERFGAVVESGWKSVVTFRFFHPIDRELSIAVGHEEIDFPHIKSCFKHLMDAEPKSKRDTKDRDTTSASVLDGPFCVKQNGTIEKDYKCVGTWRVERI